VSGLDGYESARDSREAGASPVVERTASKRRRFMIGSERRGNANGRTVVVAGDGG
jgi:hypothetical protein